MVIIGQGGPTAQGWHHIEAFLRCPKEWQLAKVRGVIQPLAATPDPLATGSLVHAGRAKWFELGFGSDPDTWVAIKTAMEQEAERLKLPASIEAVRLATTVMSEYVQHWRTRPRPTPLAVEYEVGPAALELDDPLFLYRTARLDDVSYYPEAGGRLCLGEAKTTSESIDSVANQYTLHGQILLQQVLWKLAPQGEAMHGPVAGVMLDVAKKPWGTERCKFGRIFLTAPPTDTLTWFVASLRGYLRAASQIGWNEPAPRNVSACTRLIGKARVPCQFRDLCQYGRGAAAQYVLQDGRSMVDWHPREGEEVPPWS